MRFSEKIEKTIISDRALFGNILITIIGNRESDPIRKQKEGGNVCAG